MPTKHPQDFATAIRSYKARIEEINDRLRRDPPGEARFRRVAIEQRLVFEAALEQIQRMAAQSAGKRADSSEPSPFVAPSPFVHPAPSSVARPTPPPFVYSEDYRAITVNGDKYCLTPNQALVFQVLHQYHQLGLAGVAMTILLGRIGSPSSRLRDSFRSGDGPKLWKLIVKAGKMKDMVCLRLPT